MVSFTGSTATGRQVMAGAAALKRVALQCSGKAPSLVFADCDIDKALDALARGAFPLWRPVLHRGNADHRRAPALRRVRRTPRGPG
jgi:hypothetical protein